MYPDKNRLSRKEALRLYTQGASSDVSDVARLERDSTRLPFRLDPPNRQQDAVQ